MALTINTNIKNDADGYLIDAKNVKGTYVVVDSLEDLADLPAATIVRGSLAFVTGVSKLYIYDYSDSWLEIGMLSKEIVAASISSTFNISNNYTFTIDYLPHSDWLDMPQFVAIHFTDISIVFTGGKFEQTALSSQILFYYQNKQYVATLNIDFTSQSNNATLSFQELQAGSGGGGSSTTKKWYHFEWNTNIYNTSDDYNIISATIDETAFNNLLQTINTQMSLNLSTKEELIALYNSLKSDDLSNQQQVLKSLMGLVAFVCNESINSGKPTFRTQYITNTEEKMNIVNVMLDTSIGSGYITHIIGLSNGTQNTMPFVDNYANTEVSGDYSKISFDANSTLTITEETETISSGSSGDNGVEIIDLGTINVDATNYNRGVNFVAFDITNKLNLSFSDIASATSLQETINKISNYAFNSAININYANNSVKSYPFYTKVVSSVVNIYHPGLQVANLEFNLGDLNLIAHDNRAFGYAKLYINYETDDSVEPNIQSIKATIVLYNTEINLEELYLDSNLNKYAIGCFDSESENVLHNLMSDMIKTFTDGYSQYLNGGHWYKLERVNNSYVYYQREYYYRADTGMMVTTNNNLEIPITLHSTIVNSLQIIEEPERFSIAQNLVVNMNGEQYKPNQASWSGSNNDNIRQFKVGSSVAPLSDIHALLSHLTGNPTYDVYNATKPTPCFVFCTESNICWKLQYDGSTNGLRAYKVVNFPFALKPKNITTTVASSGWTSDGNIAPFDYKATITLATTIGANTIVELVNNNAVAFATYGFSIGDVTGQVVTIYSIGQPSANIDFLIKVGE